MSWYLKFEEKPEGKGEGREQEVDRKNLKLTYLERNRVTTRRNKECESFCLSLCYWRYSRRDTVGTMN